MSPYVPSSDNPEERAILVGVKLPGSTLEEERENLLELEQLAGTAGARVVDRSIQQRTRIDGSTYVGAGFLERLSRRVVEKRVNLVIFDDDLSPAQARNIEKYLGINVIDRTELILDIFARRARTGQARIQVEIAQLAYALPRLRRLWEHLSRQVGGIGTRGPGETQLEVDRRRVRERIAHLKKDLEKIGRQTAEKRKKRRSVFNVTIVGYTNAGKSTLLNRLSGSGVLESGRLFSTLDSTSRKVEIPEAEAFVLTDTVGFIRKLPAHLVASFRATLMDVREADLLLHLVDISKKGYEDRIRIVGSVLDRVSEDGGPGGGEGLQQDTLLVFNKVDLLSEEEGTAPLESKYPDAVLVSAASGKGADSLLDAIRERMERGSIDAIIEIPAAEGRAIAMLEEYAKVRDRAVEGETMIFTARIKRKDLGKIEDIGSLKVRIL